MPRVLSFLLFVGTFLAIIFGMHIFTFQILGKHLGFELTKRLLIGLLLLSSSFIIAASIERTMPNLFGRVLFYLSSVWLGVIFVLFAFTAVFVLLGAFIPFPSQAGAIAVMVLACLAVLGGMVNASILTTKEVPLKLDHIKDEVRLVQITDLHVGTMRGRGFMEDVVAKVNSLSPDVVVITGDLFDSSRKLDPDKFKALDGIKADTYFVTGNHEVYEGLDYVFSALGKTKVRPLRDELILTHGIQLIGIDYAGDNVKGNPALERIKVDKSLPSVMLYHVPSGIEQAAKKGIDLQLSGHTHAGQVFPFNYLTKLQFRRYKGLHDVDGTWLYVSPGTGTWGPPMRIGSRNEITLFRLLPG